jgi:hypothetical protein
VVRQAESKVSTLPRRVESKRLVKLLEATLSQKPVSIGPRRTGSPHEFYRYPARFSPGFARAAIEAFTKPGEVVLDPFVGGGTTLVEAMRTRRQGIGADLNELATFVSKVKTSVLNEADLIVLRRWVRLLPQRLDLARPIPPLDDWRERGYLKDIDGIATSDVRSHIALAISAVGLLPQEAQRDFARCIVLRTAQWALDMRTAVPTSEEFVSAMSEQASSMLKAAQLFAKELEEDYFVPVILNQRSPGLADRLVPEAAPRLILTSPPYPGVYVIYHRWKMNGRREIPAPYWIANQNDGLGMSSYTMSAKTGPHFDPYFKLLGEAYGDLRRIAKPNTVLVQIVGFNNVASQFDRYLETMQDAGFEEVFLPELATADDGRLWRSVPGRRWWTTTTTLKESAPSTAKEVVLIHRVARND